MEERFFEGGFYMKSTKVKIGFLLAVLAAVLFAGCNQLTKDDLSKEFGWKTRAQRKEQFVQQVKSQIWENFYRDTFSSTYNLRTQNVSKDEIVTLVNKVNKQYDNSNKPATGKFDPERGMLSIKLTYTGSGEKFSDYASKDYYEIKAAFSQRFDITISGDIDKYLELYGDQK